MKRRTWITILFDSVIRSIRRKGTDLLLKCVLIMYPEDTFKVRLKYKIVDLQKDFQGVLDVELKVGQIYTGNSGRYYVNAVSIEGPNTYTLKVLSVNKLTGLYTYASDVLSRVDDVDFPEESIGVPGGIKTANIHTLKTEIFYNYLTKIKGMYERKN